MKLSAGLKLLLLLIIFIMKSAPLIAAVEKPELELSPEDRAILEKGELVTKIEEFKDKQGNENHRISHYLIIDVPPREVWKVLKEPEKDKEWITGTDVSEVIKRDKNFVDIHYEVKILFMVFEINIHRVFYPDILFIKNDHIEEMENDVEVVDAYYAFYPIDNGKRTIMNYSLRLVVNPNIPRVVQDMFAKQSGKGWMMNLKKRAESKGTWKK